jgi:crotonobetainyl-CoA:carnitine CoA-transferase CaiB-like acyl-CoA transferase
MRRFGLDGATLLERYPQMIVGSSSGNGSTGPAALTAGLASIFSAAGGLSEQTGYPDGPPTEIGESTDYRSGNAFVLAILAALIHRDRTGLGQAIDLSSTEAVAAIAPDALLAHFTGADAPARRGNAHDRHAPHGLYPAAGEDEWISIAVTSEDEWRGLCRLLDRPDLAGEHATPQARKAAEARLDAVIADWTRARGAREAFLALQAHGVPSAPCLTNKQLAEDPHLAARGVFVDVEHPVIGPQRVMGPPWRFSESGVCSIRRHGPRLGEDNDYVLAELRGLSADERAALSTALR